MAKIIRPRYSVEFSIGILLLIFVLSLFLSPQLFEVRGAEMNVGKNVYMGMGLVSMAVIIMLLVLWEEFLFPVRIKSEGEGFVFRNHRNKLKTQVLIYCAIEYKNNEKGGIIQLADLQQIVLVRDERKVLHKIQLDVNNSQVLIDLDEMELDAFLDAIDKFLSTRYKNLVKGEEESDSLIR